MKKDEKVKPCPFCGNDNIFCMEKTDEKPGRFAFVYCDMCGCRGPLVEVKSKIHAVFSEDDLNRLVFSWNNQMKLNTLADSWACDK